MYRGKRSIKGASIMIQSVGFFTKGDVYDWGYSQTISFAEALKRQGIKVELFGLPNSPLREVINRSREQLPDVVCSLMALDDDVVFDLLLEQQKVPYVLYSVDLSAYYFHIVYNKLAIVTSIDEEDIALLHSMGFNKSFLLPLACEKNIRCNLSDSKEFPIVYIGTCWDYESEIELWKKKLAPHVVDIMLEVCDAVFKGKSQIRVMHDILRERNLRLDDVPYCVMQRQITQYTKGKDRVDLVRSIKKHPVHIFGRNNLHKGWDHYLKGQENVHIHPSVNFIESIELMRQSKIVLNGAPQFRHGLHDRIFNGLGSGALVLTDDNPIMKNHFIDGEDLLLYRQGECGGIDDKIAPYLENANLRNEIVMSGREKVLKSHTWDHRAEVFIREVSKSLEKMPC